MVQKTRMLLDTNIWRYIADANALSEIVRAVRESAAEIVVAPSVAYEILRTSDTDLRRRQMSIVTSSTWRRLKPEAYSEAMELLTQIQRHRPDWLRTPRDPRLAKLLRKDWSRRNNGFWSRARLRADQEGIAVKELGDEDIELARVDANRRRDEARELLYKEGIPLNKVFETFEMPQPGWTGEPIEAWRMFALHSTDHALSRPDHPYREWLSGEVDFHRMMLDRAGRNKFWIYDVDATAMPRFWIRWAFEHLARFRRVTSGTPCDIQLATYLIEVDVIVSADRALLNILDGARPFGPCRLANGMLVPGGSRSIEALLRLVRSA